MRCGHITDSDSKHLSEPSESRVEFSKSDFFQVSVHSPLRADVKVMSGLFSNAFEILPEKL